MFNTNKYYKSRNVEDLSYNMTTSEGFKYKFSSNLQGLHMYKVNMKQEKNLFGTNATNNVTIFEGSYHTLIEIEDKQIGGDTWLNYRSTDSTQNDGREEIKLDTNEDLDSTGVNHSIERTRFEEGINTIIKSWARFSKRDQIRADRVCRLQYVARFLADETLHYSVMMNRIKNNPVTKRDIKICNDILNKSQYIAQGKSTISLSTPIKAHN